MNITCDYEKDNIMFPNFHCENKPKFFIFAKSDNYFRHGFEGISLQKNSMYSLCKAHWNKIKVFRNMMVTNVDFFSITKEKYMKYNILK